MVNNKIYIGKTKQNLRNRILGHKSHAKSGTNTLFYTSIRKHGFNKFCWKTLDIAQTDEEACMLEQIYIEMFGTNFKELGYNMTLGGEIGNSPNQEVRNKISVSLKGRFAGDKNPNYGRKHTEEEKKLMGKAHVGNLNMLGKHHSKETKERLSNLHKGKTISTETKSKMSLASKGKPKTEKHKQHMHNPKSEEHKRKISQSKLGVPRSEITKQKLRECKLGQKNVGCRQVRCITTGEVFAYIKLAAGKYNVDNSAITKCCKGKQKQTGNYQWEYYYG